MADDAPDLNGETDDDADLGELELADAAVYYEAQTSRLRVYASLLRVTVPRIGETARECGTEPELCVDVVSARNLALHAIYTDIRRIASGETSTTEGM